MSIRILGAALVASVIAAALTGAPALGATAHKHHAKRHHKKRSAAPTLDAVPAAESSAFAVLRQPAVTTVPRAIVRAADAEGSGIAQIGLGPNLTRSVTIDGSTFYVVPAREGLCLFSGDGAAVCATRMAEILAQGVNGVRVPAPSGPADPRHPVGTGQATTYGIVPDDVTSISAVTQSGELVALDRSGSGYLGHYDTSDPIVTTVFGHADGRTTTASGG